MTENPLKPDDQTVTLLAQRGCPDCDGKGVIDVEQRGSSSVFQSKSGRRSFRLRVICWCVRIQSSSESGAEPSRYASLCNKVITASRGLRYCNAPKGHEGECP